MANVNQNVLSIEQGSTRVLDAIDLWAARTFRKVDRELSGTERSHAPHGTRTRHAGNLQNRRQPARVISATGGGRNW